MFKGGQFKKDKTDTRKRPERERKALTTTKALTNIHPAPDGLNNYAVEEWDRLMRNVSNLIHPQDLGLLEIACRAWGVYIELENSMKSVAARFTITPNGMAVLSAEAIESGRQLAIYQKIVIQFGITPLSRLKIAEPKGEDKPKDPMQELLSKLG